MFSPAGRPSSSVSHGKFLYSGGGRSRIDLFGEFPKTIILERVTLEADWLIRSGAEGRTEHCLEGALFRGLSSSQLARRSVTYGGASNYRVIETQKDSPFFPRSHRWMLQNTAE